MARFGAAAWLFVIVAVASIAPGAALGAHANELVKDGTAVSLPGMDNLAKTADHQLRDNLIRLLGSVVAIGGLVGTQKNVGAGLTGAASGVGIIFVPGIMGSGADSVAAATSLAFVTQTPLAVWGQWIQGMVSEACLMMVALVGYRQWRRQSRERSALSGNPLSSY